MSETKELILNALAEIIKKYPQQRFGQIIYNYICANCPNNDPFYEEDAALLYELEKIIKKK